VSFQSRDVWPNAFLHTKPLRARTPSQRSLRLFASVRSCAGPSLHSRELPGFRSLLARALTLARAEAPSLSAVQVAADGSLRGLDELASQTDKEQARDGGAILIAQLIGLLLTFVGEGLTFAAGS